MDVTNVVWNASVNGVTRAEARELVQTWATYYPIFTVREEEDRTSVMLGYLAVIVVTFIREGEVSIRAQNLRCDVAARIAADLDALEGSVVIPRTSMTASVRTMFKPDIVALRAAETCGCCFVEGGVSFKLHAPVPRCLVGDGVRETEKITSNKDVLTFLLEVNKELLTQGSGTDDQRPSKRGRK